MAKRYVAAKVSNGMKVLQAYDYSGSNPFKFEERERMDKVLQTMEAGAHDLNSLRGYEGTAARLYFAGFARCLMHGRKFPGRVFHPSTDTVNAALSFGYSFIAREIQAALEAIGLDPYIGFFHDITYGRASLSLDLMEEFRHPLVDRLVLKLFNRRILDDGDFECAGQGEQVYLKKSSLNIFIRHYEEWANSVNRMRCDDGEVSWRRMIWKQAEKLRKAIENSGDYTPYTWEAPSRAKDGAPRDEDHK